MTIATIRDAARAERMIFEWQKIASRTSVGAYPESVFDQSGYPPAGTLGGTSTAAGVVPTDATTGTPPIYPEATSEVLALSRVRYASTVACRLMLFDLLWKAGAYAFNANQALTAQPSFTSRLPDTDYTQVEAWFEAVTAFTGNASVTLTYTDQDGNGGATTVTGNVAYAPIVGRMYRFALAAGDSGIQKVDNVASTIATAGTFNVLLLRRLWEGRVFVPQLTALDTMLRVNLPRIYGDSAIIGVVQADSTATGLPQMNFFALSDN